MHYRSSENPPNPEKGLGGFKAQAKDPPPNYQINAQSNNGIGITYSEQASGMFCCVNGSADILSALFSHPYADKMSALPGEIPFFCGIFRIS